MGWQGDLCLLDLVRLHLKTFCHRWKWFEKMTCPTRLLVMEELFKKKIRPCRLNQSNERTVYFINEIIDDTGEEKHAG
jgi:hypothetical protein